MSTKISKTYAIISINDLNKIDFLQVGETSEQTIRKSLDGTQFVLKWNVEPSFISSGEVLPMQVLTHVEVVELMNTATWQEPIPEVE